MKGNKRGISIGRERGRQKGEVGVLTEGKDRIRE
jgi:hypothetical protein